MPRPRELDPAVAELGARLLSEACAVLGSNLRVRRLALGKTQERLAEEVGVSTIYVQALERGRDENPTLRVLALLAQALEVPLSVLLAVAGGRRLRVNAAPEPPPKRPPKRSSRVRKKMR